MSNTYVAFSSHPAANQRTSEQNEPISSQPTRQLTTSLGVCNTAVNSTRRPPLRLPVLIIRERKVVVQKPLVLQ